MEINQFTPSEMQSIAKKDMELQHLILTGYDLRADQQINVSESAALEYNYPDNKCKVFVAYDNERIIASLNVLFLENTPEDDTGRRFWTRLGEQSILLPSEEKVFKIAGIVVDPKYRGKHVATSILNHVLETIHPAVVVSSTKTVDAVTAALYFSEKNSFRTAYGSTEITQGNHNSADIIPFTYAFLYADEQTVLQEGMVYINDNSGLASTIPDTTGYPEIIQQAFIPVIRAQKRIGSNHTVMAPLVSVRKDIIDSFTT